MRSKILKLVKIILINIGIFLMLLIGFNLLIMSAFEIKSYLISNNKPKEDYRIKLPNYKEYSWTKLHFKEFRKTKREYRSYTGWRTLAFSGKTININEEGVRFTPQSIKVDEHSDLVVFIGGSTTRGYGSTDSLTIPALVSLYADGRYKTLNFGESGYRAYQGYLFLQNNIYNGLRPDVIVSYDGVNDVNGHRIELRPDSHTREHQIKEILKGKDQSELKKNLSLKHYLFSPIQTMIKRYKLSDKSSNIFFDYSPKRSELVARTLLNSWLATKNMADEYGAEYLAILQPAASVGHPKLDHFKLDTINELQQKYYYPYVRDLIKNDSVYKELKGSFLDLSHSFDVDEYIFFDPGHVTPNGNLIIAKKIINWLDEDNP